ncbi:MAG TPA: CDP-alcohol phosphatidyltransferase family protein [Thiobacillaceae bacterium]|nr:CDP-alcohol phosphatidyltransferase family protein [Thiobacillaceae bacterium]HNH90310.1 CDP-alcohol phosphatidyltransferase family protein [Thiobacillaceae bacterium]
MPSVYDLKPAFQGLLRPLVRGLARAGVTANQVTLAAMLLSLATGAAIALAPERSGLLLLLPAVLFLRMALNAIDGMLAREHDQKTRLGAVLNELGDVVSDAALYLPLALVPGFAASLIVLIVVGAALSEMTGVLTQTLGASRRYDGPMGKSDRAFVFGTVGLALGLGLPGSAWLNQLLGIVLLLLGWTVANRARRGLEELAP